MLKDIFEFIVPEQIKNNFYTPAINVFFEYLEKHSDISIEIKNYFSQDKPVIYEELIKIYLRNIWDVFQQSEHNEALYIKLKEQYQTQGLDIDLLDLKTDLKSILSKDYFISHKAFKQSKGTRKAFQYAYNIINRSGIQKDILNLNTDEFKFYDGEKLFTYNIEGTMDKTIFEHYVKPLCHPVGWSLFYLRVFYENFTDEFNILYHYKFLKFRVRCIKDNIEYYDDYQTNTSRIGKKLMPDEILYVNRYGDTSKTKSKDFYKEIPGNAVKNIEYNFVGPTERRQIFITFYNGYRLVSLEKPFELILYNEKGQIVRDYNDSIFGKCFLDIEFDKTDIEICTLDDIKFRQDFPLASTYSKMNVFGAGNVFYGSTYIDKLYNNENISVTFNSPVGKSNGLTVIDINSLENIFYDSEYCFDSENFVFDSFGDGKEKLYFDISKKKVDTKNFYFDYIIKKKFKDLRKPLKGYPRYDDTNETNNFAVSGYFGMPCVDDLDIQQIPNDRSPLNLIDDMQNSWNYDSNAYFDENQTFEFRYRFFDAGYINDEIDFEYPYNRYDTDIQFDYFIFNGKYQGGYDDRDLRIYSECKKDENTKYSSNLPNI